MVSAAVAACTLGLALAEGGYYPGAFSVVALLAWGLVLVGVAAGFLPRADPGRTAVVAGCLLAGLAALTALSLVWANDRGAAFDEVVIALAYAGVFALVAVASAGGEAAAWLRGLAIGLSLVAVVALVSRLEPSLFGAGERELGDPLLAGRGRLGYPIGYWNGLAAAMATCIVLVAWLAAQEAARWARVLATVALPVAVVVLYMTTSRGGMLAAAIGLAALLVVGPARIRLAASAGLGVGAGLLLVALVAGKEELLDRPGTPLAASEGGEFEPLLLAVLAAVGAVAYAWDPLVRRLRAPALPRWMRERWVVVAASLVAVVAVVALVVVVDPAERWEGFKQPPTASDIEGSAERDVFGRGGSSGRYQFWSTAVDAFESDPLTGIGAGGYEAWWNQHGSLPNPTRNGHSLFFDTLAELGLVGGLLVLAFFTLVLVVGVRRCLEHARSEGAGPAGRHRAAGGAALAVVVVGVVGAAGDWTWEVPAVFAPVVFAAALLTGPGTRAGGEGAARPVGERRTRRRFAAGVVVLGFAWVAICASALLLLTNLSLHSSRNAAGDGNLAKATDAANDAIDLEPWAAEPHEQLALVLEESGDIEGARAELAEAIDRAPEDWRLWLVAARLALESGDPPAARAAALEAQRLGPRLEPLDRPVREILDGLV